MSSSIKTFIFKDTVITDSKIEAPKGIGGCSFSEGIGEGLYENLCLRNTSSPWAGEGIGIFNSTKPTTIRLSSMTGIPHAFHDGNNFVFPRYNDVLRQSEDNYSHSSFVGGNMMIAWNCKKVLVDFVTLAWNEGDYLFNDEHRNDAFELKCMNVVNNKKVRRVGVFHPNGVFAMRLERIIFIGNSFEDFNSGGAEVKDCVFQGNDFKEDSGKAATHTLKHQEDWECLTNHLCPTGTYRADIKRKKELIMAQFMIT